VATREDLDQLAACIRDRPITVIADEVYEHVLFDGRRHQSVLAHPELRERSYAVFSFGKTLHATGWRVGYCVAPPAMTRELRKVHQFNTFSIASPLQYAIARYLSAYPEAWQGLSAFFQLKRDLLAGLLRGSGLEPLPAGGTYFQLVDYGAISQDDDLKFADRLIREAKIAVIPLTPFYAKPPRMTLVRLCIAKRDETLQEAAKRLAAFAQRAARSDVGPNAGREPV
jgi:methionine aminotransferase